MTILDAIPSFAELYSRPIPKAHDTHPGHCCSTQPGDSVILNAANSTIGTLIIQLCRMLKLRTVAIVRDNGEFEKSVIWLKSLGATEVRATYTVYKGGATTPITQSLVCVWPAFSPNHGQQAHFVLALTVRASLSAVIKRARVVGNGDVQQVPPKMQSLLDVNHAHCGSHA